LENFSDHRRIFWSGEEKNGAVFQKFFETVNLYEIFYAMQVVGKIYLSISFIGRVVDFHFHTVLDFSN
jgi:hypothetical protein